jgi:hypothetical protein
MTRILSEIVPDSWPKILRVRRKRTQFPPQSVQNQSSDSLTVIAGFSHPRIFEWSLSDRILVDYLPNFSKIQALKSQKSPQKVAEKRWRDFEALLKVSLSVASKLWRGLAGVELAVFS